MNEKILLPELAELLAKEAKCSKRTAELFLKEFFTLAEEVVTSGETLKINGLGTFKPIWVAPRESINVQTGEPFLIPGHYKLSFSPDKKLRDAVNAPFACFDMVVLDADGHELHESKPDENESEEENEEEPLYDFEETPEPEERSTVITIQETAVRNPGSCDIKERYGSVPLFTECSPEQPAEKLPEETGNPLIVEQEEMVVTGFEAAESTLSAIREEPRNFTASGEIQDESAISGSEADFTVKAGTDAGFSANTTFCEPELCDSYTIGNPEHEETGMRESTESSKEIIGEALPAEAGLHADHPVSPECTPYYTTCSTEPLLEKTVQVPEEIQQFSAHTGKGKDSPRLQETGDERARRKGVKYTLIGGFILLFFIGIYIFRFLHTTGDSGTPLYTELQEEETNVTAPAVTEEESPAGISGQEDAAPVVSDVTPEKTVQPAPVKAVTPVTEEIRPGIFMTKLALKHYGNKVFWVYIYEENKNRIKNPNKIPIGTRLIIPDKSKYGIDAGKAESVETAKRKAEELKRLFD